MLDSVMGELYSIHSQYVIMQALLTHLLTYLGGLCSGQSRRKIEGTGTQTYFSLGPLTHL